MQDLPTLVLLARQQDLTREILAIAQELTRREVITTPEPAAAGPKICGACGCCHLDGACPADQVEAPAVPAELDGVEPCKQCLCVGWHREWCPEAFVLADPELLAADQVEAPGAVAPCVKPGGG